MTDHGGPPPGPAHRRSSPPRGLLRRLLLLATAGAVALAVWALTLLSPSPAPAPDPASLAGPAAADGAGGSVAPGAVPLPVGCAPVTLVTAGGGPASPGPLPAVAGSLSSLAPRLQIVDVPRPGPAADPAAWSRALRASLDTTAGRCPGTSLLVYAWSEGAAAATSALTAMEAEASPAAPRITGVALVGNPARDPARRTLPAAVRGAGVTPSAPGSLGRLAADTVEICAPADPVCAATAPGGPGVLASVLGAPAHDDYARLPTGIGGRTAGAWLTDAARQAVDLAAPPAPPGGPAPAPAPLLRAAPGLSGPFGAFDALGLPLGNPPGLIWRAASGGNIDYPAFDRNTYDEQSGNPVLVRSPNLPGRAAMRFSVPAGQPRSEMQPRTPDPREGQTRYIGYYGVLGPDFPVGVNEFQVILQWHHEGSSGSPPVTMEVSHGELRLTGGERRPFIASVAPVRPGAALDLVLKVTFSSDPRRGSVSAWKDGRQVVRDVHPPEGTIYRGDDSAYMKMGVYRSTSNPGRATLYVNDVLVGPTLASVSPVRSGPGGASPGNG